MLFLFAAWSSREKKKTWKRGAPQGNLEALSIQPKLSKIWNQRQMVQKFPGTICQQILEISSGSKVEWKIKLPEKTLVYLTRLSSVQILENPVPFATGSCREINRAFSLVIVFKTVRMLNWTLYTVKKKIHFIWVSMYLALFVLTEDFIMTSPNGDETTIFCGHPNHRKV